MADWPTIDEPELLERLALDDAGFEEFARTLVSRVPRRDCDATALELALGYPWERPACSFRLADGIVEPFEELPAARRLEIVAELTSDGRVPLLAIGSNGAPEGLERKFAHFPDPEDRTVLALAGSLHDFDVGVSPQPALYGSLPATLFPSPGTAVRTTLLWLTPAQFTQLVWSELSYRLGRLDTPFETDDGPSVEGGVLAFVSRFGAFGPQGRPVALAAVPASGRTAPALTQEQLLDAVAELALGPGATAEALVRAVFENFGALAPRLAATSWRAALPFVSERWTPFEAV